jgi:hypothetical protein
LRFLNHFVPAMRLLIFLLLAALFFSRASGQITNFTTTQIDSIIKRIDLTCISGGITDYTFHKKASEKKQLGGGANWYYTDSAGANLLKVTSETSLSVETMDSYYFYRDSLIYFRRTVGVYDGDKKTINCTQECYFTGEKILLQQDNPNIAFVPKTILETASKFFIGEQIWKRSFK